VVEHVDVAVDAAKRAVVRLERAERAALGAAVGGLELGLGHERRGALLALDLQPAQLGG
jgi:hypothetical protein